MGSQEPKKETMRRLNSRIFITQSDYIKKLIDKSKGKMAEDKMTEGEALRMLLDKGIEADKQK